MRSMEDPSTADEPGAAARRFGAFLTRAAKQAGYDVTSGAGGRVALAEASGMSPSAIGRTVDGKTLPRPTQLAPLAKAVGLDVRTLLVEAGVIPAELWSDDQKPPVRSITLTPEDAADHWGITDPMVRRMLLSSVQEAIRLQQEVNNDQRGTAAGGN
ncbi:XRE family transcriptional regulator [Streptomyces niveus]|uniref:XRE family transcriptional regulator n=1 Tax=Streptomyces niveus TaxID=193462 RepID=UPI00363C873D